MEAPFFNAVVVAMPQLRYHVTHYFEVLHESKACFMARKPTHIQYAPGLVLTRQRALFWVCAPPPLGAPLEAALAAVGGRDSGGGRAGAAAAAAAPQERGNGGAAALGRRAAGHWGWRRRMRGSRRGNVLVMRLPPLLAKGKGGIVGIYDNRPSSFCGELSVVGCGGRGTERDKKHIRVRSLHTLVL